MKNASLISVNNDLFSGWGPDDVRGGQGSFVRLQQSDFLITISMTQYESHACSVVFLSRFGFLTSYFLTANGNILTEDLIVEVL